MTNLWSNNLERGGGVYYFKKVKSARGARLSPEKLLQKRYQRALRLQTRACDMDSLLEFDEISERLSPFPDPNNNNGEYGVANTAKGDKYSLRPRSVRRVTEVSSKSSSDSETDKTKPSKSHRTKQKPAPLSKYRRKTANARERNRMREINMAFETLRNVIPHIPNTQVPGANEKLTKITTLRLAMKYIATLSAALTGPDDFQMETFSKYSDLDCLLLESDGESLPLSDGSMLASPDFPEPSLSPVNFSDPSLPALLHTDFTEHTLETEDFSELFAT